VKIRSENMEKRTSRYARKSDKEKEVKRDKEKVVLQFFTYIIHFILSSQEV
jgi:hypothetical protein